MVVYDGCRDVRDEAVLRIVGVHTFLALHS